MTFFEVTSVLVIVAFATRKPRVEIPLGLPFIIILGLNPVVRCCFRCLTLEVCLLPFSKRFRRFLKGLIPFHGAKFANSPFKYTVTLDFVFTAYSSACDYVGIHIGITVKSLATLSDFKYEPHCYFIAFLGNFSGYFKHSNPFHRLS